MTGLCPEERLQALIAQTSADEGNALTELEMLIAQYGDDPRLHFLKGSFLAAGRDYEGARISMRRAVDLAPDFAIARFQLGFLLLTSGEPHAAQEAWGPLHGLSPDHYLRMMVVGLTYLIHDEFRETIEWLRKGMAANQENLALNNDMQLIITEVEPKLEGSVEDDEPVSSVHQLLQQSALKSTKH